MRPLRGVPRKAVSLLARHGVLLRALQVAVRRAQKDELVLEQLAQELRVFSGVLGPVASEREPSAQLGPQSAPSLAVA